MNVWCPCYQYGCRKQQALIEHEIREPRYVFVAGNRLATMMTDEAAYLADGLWTDRYRGQKVCFIY